MISVTVTDCKNRWASLRDQFKKKHREMSTTVSGQAAKKRRKWYLYDFLTFLIPTCSTGETSSNLPDIGDLLNPDQDDNGSLVDQIQETQSQDTQDHPSDDDSLVSDVAPLRKNRPIRCSRKGQDTSAIDKQVIDAFREAQNEMPIDENEHFFKSLMPIMKTLDVMQALELRGEIQKLVFSFVKSLKTRETHAPQQTIIPPTQPSTSTSGAAQLQLQQSQQQPFYVPDQYFTQQAYSP